MATPSEPYVVVARRYRPQAFGELVGQEHVAQALSNAIATHRVGHAYLFTGARGVGKTSTARILAKALNCEHGPNATPCNVCDNCQRISAGDDVDVLEIDGASNRGIDEIRQLRQNVNVRPSRSRFKIYIIDEVHMLTREAFNALLKTLEEPPEHVKFIFCTTEATKIPITILSRCQRFDFAGILTRSIFDRLRQIVAAEGVEAEPEALEVIARRAAGSMRDSQSLLEQLLAFASARITVADVHGMLGTAGDQRLATLVEHLVERRAAGALAELAAAGQEGVDAGQLIEQLFGYFRDCMVAAVDCPAETFLYCSPSSGNAVIEAGKRMGLQTILAAMQILDQTLSRMRYSTQGRILAELALVRICNLEDLDELANLAAQLRSGVSAIATPVGRPAAGPDLKKNVEVSRPGNASLSSAFAAQRPTASAPAQTPAQISAAIEQIPALRQSAPQPPITEIQPTAAEVPPSGPVTPLTADNAVTIWREALERLSNMIAEQGKLFESVALAPPNRLVVSFTPEHALARATCQRPEQVARFERLLAEMTGQTIRLDFAVCESSQRPAPPVAAAPRVSSPFQRLQEVAQHPMIQRANQLFGARPVRIDDP